MIGTTPSRAELWMMFAAAAMGVGDPAENTALAAKAADRMLAEFNNRFPDPPGAPVVGDAPVGWGEVGWGDKREKS